MGIDAIQGPRVVRHVAHLPTFLGSLRSLRSPSFLDLCPFERVELCLRVSDALITRLLGTLLDLGLVDLESLFKQVV